MMIYKHVLRTFAKKKLTLFLLGIVIMLSSFVYVALHMGAATIEKATEAYFDDYNQEDFVFEMSPYITPKEHQLDLEHCVIQAPTMPALYQQDKACYYELIDQRITALKTLEAITLEARFFKDITSVQNDHTHRFRLMQETVAINRSYYTQGQKPAYENEIAILENYANHNDIKIGDTLVIRGEDYEVTGFLLLPDYTLPVFDHVFAYGTESQTLMMVHPDFFDALSEAPNYHLGGIFLDEPFGVSEFYERHDTENYGIQHMMLTENNIRSGAIYTEIQASYASGLFISIIIAFIGIVIVGLMMKKTLEQSQRPFGILKALGMEKKELMWPYLTLILGFSFLALWLGYMIGFLFAPILRDVYLAFYLLPKTDVEFSFLALLIGVFAPFLVLFVMGFFITNRLLNQDALHMMHPPITKMAKVHQSRLRRLINKLGFNTRYQTIFMLRHKLKVLIYAVGVFFAFFLSFLALGMLDVFEATVTDYYDSVHYTHIGYYPEEAQPGDKVIEINALIYESPAMLIGLSENQTMHPLFDKDGRDLTPRLNEGLVISQSFALLNDLALNDRIEIYLGAQKETYTVVGVANIYPGDHVFTDRAMLAKTFFNDADYYNTIYADYPLDETQFQSVFSVDTLLNQIDDLNEVTMQVFYVIVLSGLFIGLIIVYLLSVLIVEDHYVHIALFKMLGYDDQAIHTILLGGYRKLNIVLFILCIPFTLWVFVLFRNFFAMMFGFIFVMSLNPLHLFGIALLYVIIFMVASRHAKKKVTDVALSVALKVYQN